MVFSTLWARLVSGEFIDRETTADGSSTEPTAEQMENDADDETLSYAEEIEYGVDERELPDEDKVLRLLVKRGGRVDQSTVREKPAGRGPPRESRFAYGRRRPDQRDHRRPKAGDLSARLRAEGYRSHLNE